MVRTDLISDLYTECNKARELLAEAQRQADDCQELAMNAAVAASHTGNHIRIFTEIARQIEQTARRISATVASARHESDKATNLILRAVILHAQDEKYRQAYIGTKGVENRALILRRTDDIDQAIGGHMVDIMRRLCQLEALVATLLQQQDRLFSVINAIRVEVLPLSGSELLTHQSLAESLENNHRLSTDTLAALAQLTLVMQHQLRASGNPEPRGLDETRQAV